MLSYQHAYHAGNAADVHKHALLATVLAYLTRKDKPLTYMETHAGRAVYDLSGPEAVKTQEAAQGIQRVASWFDEDHPYTSALKTVRQAEGKTAYPGSPYIARHLLRPTDRLILAELHPQESEALRAALPGVDVRKADGPALALSIAPPDPRRGLCLIDPAYEVKAEYSAMPHLLAKLHRKWPVGVLMLWYPILTSGAERGMVKALHGLNVEKTLLSEVRFAPARPGHGMVGSGLFVINPPWGLAEAARDLERQFKAAL
ncbi:MAG: 23S rRNA (adenine(2030)-N(6))-methyltransferase RlmJ [Paracoccaceae bacterium]